MMIRSPYVALNGQNSSFRQGRVPSGTSLPSLPVRRALGTRGRTVTRAGREPPRDPKGGNEKEPPAWRKAVDVQINKAFRSPQMVTLVSLSLSELKKFSYGPRTITTSLTSSIY
jgi:hypothetical protein